VLVALARAGRLSAVVETQSAQCAHHAGQRGEIGPRERFALFDEGARDDQQMAFDHRILVEHQQVIGAGRTEGQRGLGGQERVDRRRRLPGRLARGIADGEGGRPAHQKADAVIVDEGLLGADGVQRAVAECMVDGGIERREVGCAARMV
jgi:hypothetical protein